MKTFDKHQIRARMLELEQLSIDEAESETEKLVSGAMIDRSMPHDADGRAQSVISANLAQQIIGQVHAHEQHLQLLESIDFAATDSVDRGALVKLNDRWLVVAVPTPRFEVDGESMLGISCEAPLVKAMVGKRAGEKFCFNGREFNIQQVL
ncbi:hypothetical protein [Pseudoxanthomonas dokdonensis]|uniref:Transcription elongation factor GreA/GreB C-terminal domain-containing protein n=1 Tax=Pseudoxanthomonas dokdonensis TaxID=344882 RepID=A0A0R0CGX8_9GAMM|nr:hypothetical protein [Pseudoxanthomonas dokdonensis]KRG69023.1 hypothetical protein ABB29_11335 [Pseudoxanthomonas dokdonensis]